MKLNALEIHVFLYFIIMSSWSCSSQAQTNPIDLESKLDSLFRQEMERQNIPGAAIIIIKDNKIQLKKGYGVPNIEHPHVKVNPDSTLFRIGSISKTFTATALLQLIDRNQVDINGDVNKYLKDIKVPSTYPQAITPKHLLSHSSGLDEIGPGRLVFSQSDLIPLNTFLSDRIIRVRPPGMAPAYSTYGIALSGLLIQDVSQQSLETFMDQNIWTPLGMNRTNFLVPDHLSSHTAVGYELQNGRNVAQPWEWYHTFPASSINSTVVDMAKYMQAHLNLGILKGNRILSEEKARSMQTQQITGHPEINGFCNGFYENSWSGQRTVEHGGNMLGFSSYMVLVPEHNMGIFVTNHHEMSHLRYHVVDLIMDLYFGDQYSPSIPSKSVNNNKSKVEQYAGTYSWLSNCQSCPDTGRDLNWEITANEDGTITMLNRKWIQVEPQLFIREDGQGKLGFRNQDGKVKFMFLGNVDAFEKVSN